MDMGFVKKNLWHELHELFLKKEWFIVKDFTRIAYGLTGTADCLRKQSLTRFLKTEPDCLLRWSLTGFRLPIKDPTSHFDEYRIHNA